MKIQHVFDLQCLWRISTQCITIGHLRVKGTLLFLTLKRKICCLFGYKHLQWKFLREIIFIHQLHVHGNQVKFYAVLKKLRYFRPQDFSYGKFPMICYFVLVFHNYCFLLRLNKFKILWKFKIFLGSILFFKSVIWTNVRRRVIFFSSLL